MPQRQTQPPDIVTHIRMTTDAARPHERFDYWREIFPSVDMAPLGVSGEGDFSGELLSVQSTQTDVTLSRTVSGANRARFNALSGEDVLLGAFVSGNLGMKDPRTGETALIPERSLYIVDAGRAPEFQVDHFTNIYLTMPRSRATELMNGDPAPKAGFRLLPETPLGEILWSHLQTVSTRFHRLSQREAGAALVAAESMGAALLNGFARPRHSDESLGDAGLVAAATRLMGQMLHRPGVTVADLARALNCSRTRLYRAFRNEGLSAGEQLREMRLHKARQLLRGTDLSVGEIALACGYADFSAFSRAFHRHYGLGPRDDRHSAHAETARNGQSG